MNFHLTIYKILITGCTAILTLTVCISRAQTSETASGLFHSNSSVTFNPFNPKITAQLELPIKHRGSFGLSANYYFMNWKGPMAEPFIRIYGRKYGNESGSFLQLKLMYGYLSTLDFEQFNGVLRNKYWQTFGGGAAYGYKILLDNNITIEPLIGIRLLSPPYYRYYPNIDESLYATLAESVIWYVSTGLPLDFQIKFGYQF